MPKLKIDDDMEIVAFTNEECAMLDEYFTGSNAENAYLLGRYCGLRINEAYGLKWENVDLEAGTIRIEQQMQYQEGLIKLVPLKTRNARHTIYLNSKVKTHLASLLEQWQNVTPAQRLQQEQNKTIIADSEGNPVSSLELFNCLLNGKIQTLNSMKYHSRILQGKYGLNFKELSPGAKTGLISTPISVPRGASALDLHHQQHRRIQLPAQESNQVKIGFPNR